MFLTGDKKIYLMSSDRVYFGEMTSRERVLAALEHRNTDRIPVDFSGHRSSGIAALLYPELRERLAQVSWEDYAAERTRYERRQEQFRRRYRWRHQRDALLQQRVADWAQVVSDC